MKKNEGRKWKMLANYCKGNGKYFKGSKKHYESKNVMICIFVFSCKGNSFTMHSTEKKESDSQDHNSNQQNFCKISIWNTPFLPLIFNPNSFWKQKNAWTGLHDTVFISSSILQHERYILLLLWFLLFCRMKHT